LLVETKRLLLISGQEAGGAGGILAACGGRGSVPAPERKPASIKAMVWTAGAL
jgi:hypothetical protein